MNALSFSESAPDAKFMMGPLIRGGAKLMGPVIKRAGPLIKGGAKFVAKQAAEVAIQVGVGRVVDRFRNKNSK